MTQRFTRVFSLAAVVCSFSLPLYSQELVEAKPEDVGMSAQKLSQIDEAIGKFIENQQVAGAVVAVARRGKIVHFEAYGQRDIEGEKPMQKDTIFRIYSMTKPITTVAAMMLWEESKFDLDDPVAKYLPQLQSQMVHVDGDGDDVRLVKPERPVSIRDLMRHTSGLTYGFTGDSYLSQLYREKNLLDRESTLADMIDKLAEVPLKQQPGTQFEYGISVDVLGRLVEVVSKQPLDEFFQQRIFTPLDMHDTGFAVPEGKLPRFATNYGPNRNGKGLRVVDAVVSSRYCRQPKLLSGGGGLVSTARDYMRFCQMLAVGGEFAGQRLLREETVQLMTRNHVPASALPIGVGDKRPGVGFGLGFAVRMKESKFDPASVVGEYRWGGAASTHFWLSPKHEIAVVVLQQHMPFTNRLERAVKPIVYRAITDD